MIAFLATFLGLVLVFRGYGALVLGLAATLAVYMANDHPELVKNVSPIFFQPSTDLLEDVNDPLGLYQYESRYTPLQITRSY